MKTFFLVVTLALMSLLTVQGMAQEKSDIKKVLGGLVERVQAKAGQGKVTENDFSDELKQLDALLEQHKGEKTDEVAEILFLKVQLYFEIIDNSNKAIDLLKQLKQEFPDTAAGKQADKIMETVVRMEASKKIQRALTVGSIFPDFQEKDINGNPISISLFKGKIVLLDFWATWCGPCKEELPNVLKAYDKCHAKGFEVIGISLDQGKDELVSFVKANHMSWAQYFDGNGWQNKLAAKYGVTEIPATYLLDKEGRIIGKNLRGAALDEAIAKAVGS